MGGTHHHSCNRLVYLELHGVDLPDDRDDLVHLRGQAQLEMRGSTKLRRQHEYEATRLACEAGGASSTPDRPLGPALGADAERQTGEHTVAP